MIKEIYLPLINSFLENNYDPEMFVRQFLDIKQKDSTISPNEDVYRVLQDIFEDAISYDPEPDPSYGAAYIDEAELRKCCQANLLKLKQIVADANNGRI